MVTRKAVARYDEQGRRLCKIAGCPRLVTSCGLKASRYICSRCRMQTAGYVKSRKNAIEAYNASEKGQARTRRYTQTTHRKAKQRANGQRSIWIGRRYHSRAATVEDARRINRHIQERLLELKQRFSSRAATEGDQAGSVQAETDA